LAELRANSDEYYEKMDILITHNKYNTIIHNRQALFRLYLLRIFKHITAVIRVNIKFKIVAIYIHLIITSILRPIIALFIKKYPET
jgi:hypothetical protein